MSEQRASEAMKFNALVPELIVADFSESLAFYVDVLGFRVEYERSSPPFAFLSFGESQLMIEQGPNLAAWQIEPLDFPRGRGINLSIHCNDARSLAERVVAAGIPLRLAVEDKWYQCGDELLGERHFLVQDPDGYLLRFAEDLDRT